MKNINQFTELHCCEEHVHLAFSSPQRVISSAILNGGLVYADHIVNRKVAKDASYSEPPEINLLNYISTNGWESNVVGMMTAAPMESLCIEKACIDGVELAVLVTTGLDNARRVGDRADVQDLLKISEEVGTINLILVCSAKLTEAAMIEAVMIVTEAKVAALQELKVLSPVSGGLATGTGTDAIAVVSGNGLGEIAFCGKHVLLGEWIGRLVIKAVTNSIASSA